MHIVKVFLMAHLPVYTKDLINNSPLLNYGRRWLARTAKILNHFSNRFQNYQQQLQQRHGHSSQSSPLQAPEGLASATNQSPVDGAAFSPGLGGGPFGGLGQSGTFSGGAQVKLVFISFGYLILG